MAIFNSYVKLPEGIFGIETCSETLHLPQFFATHMFRWFHFIKQKVLVNGRRGRPIFMCIYIYGDS